MVHWRISCAAFSEKAADDELDCDLTSQSASSSFSTDAVGVFDVFFDANFLSLFSLSGLDSKGLACEFSSLTNNAHI